MSTNETAEDRRLAALKNSVRQLYNETEGRVVISITEIFSGIFQPQFPRFEEISHLANLPVNDLIVLFYIANCINSRTTSQKNAWNRVTVEVLEETNNKQDQLTPDQRKRIEFLSALITVYWENRRHQ